MPMTREDWMKLRLARDFHTGEFLFDKDPVYRHKCFQEQLAMTEEEMKAQKPAPVPNADDLAHLNRWQSAVNPRTGKRYFEDPGAARDNIERMRAEVFAGGRLSADVIAATEGVIQDDAGVKVNV